MRIIAEHLEHAIQFERMAEGATSLKFKARLLEQAAAYRKLAEQRAKKLNITPPKPPPQPDGEAPTGGSSGTLSDGSLASPAR